MGNLNLNNRKMKALILSALLLSVVMAQPSATRQRLDTTTEEIDLADICPKGEHYDTTWSMNKWGFQDGCQTNNRYCNDYQESSGNCVYCGWWANDEKETSAGSGSWCSLTWWTWLLVILGSIIAFAILCAALAALFRCCCKKDSQYQRLH